MSSDILVELYKITKDSFNDTYNGNENRMKMIHEIISKNLTIEQKLACYSEREKRLVKEMKELLEKNDDNINYNKKELLNMLSLSVKDE